MIVKDNKRDRKELIISKEIYLSYHIKEGKRNENRFIIITEINLKV